MVPTHKSKAYITIIKPKNIKGFRKRNLNAFMALKDTAALCKWNHYSTFAGALSVLVYGEW